MYWMYREDGRVGDSGPMSDMIIKRKGVAVREADARPEVGGVMQVGTYFARSYTAQDYWQTTKIEEILKEETVDGRDTVTFRTQNSVYTWKN